MAHDLPKPLDCAQMDCKFWKHEACQWAGPCVILQTRMEELEAGIQDALGWRQLTHVRAALEELLKRDVAHPALPELCPVYPGPDLMRGDIVFTPGGFRAEVWSIDPDQGVQTSEGWFSASELRRPIQEV